VIFPLESLVCAFSVSSVFSVPFKFAFTGSWKCGCSVSEDRFARSPFAPFHSVQVRVPDTTKNPAVLRAGSELIKLLYLFTISAHKT